MALIVLSLLIGALVVSTSTALLYAAWLSSAGSEMTALFLAIASVCGFGFATLGGWLTALVAQKAPIVHAITLSLILAIVWGLYTFTGDAKDPLNLSLLNLALGAAGVIAGGWIRSIQIKARDKARET